MVTKHPCVATRGRNLESWFGLILLTSSLLASTLFTLSPAFGQTRALPRTSFEDQAAFLLSNGTVELTVLERGSTFAKVTLAGDPGELSPLWDPVRMAREAGEKPQPESAQGHFICVDGFGPLSPQEKAAGLPGHGKRDASTFEVKAYAKDGRTTTLSLTTKLPITQELFTRTVRMVDGENVIYVRSELKSLLGFDRPAFWG